VSKIIEIGSNSDFSKNHSLQANINLREIKDLNLDTTKNIIQGKINSINNFGDIIKSNLSYATSNGRELRREYIFTRVGSGQGTHTWRDENADGLQDLNEFYEAINPDEKNYIKLYVPTADYVEAFQTMYTHMVKIGLPENSKSRLTKFVSRFLLESALNINFKTTSTSMAERLNPFNLLSGSDNILSGRSRLRNSIFFNRNQKGFGANITNRKRENLQLLQNGFERSMSDETVFGFRFNLTQYYQVDHEMGIESRNNTSDFLESRNFLIQSRHLSSQVSWLPTNRIRLSSGFRLRNQYNRIEEGGNENSQTRKYHTGIMINGNMMGNINANVEFVDIDFEGDPDSYLGYVMLDALRPGNNWRWSCNWQHQLKKGLQLSLQYFGRKSEKDVAIHSGSMSLTAFF
jgi:hypothetical protein